jgi:rhamnose transport system permease protein
MIQSAETAGANSVFSPRRFVERLLRLREFRLLLALLIISLAVTLREPRFLQPANLEQVALSATLVCIVAIGQALVIIAKQIDLSVGAIVAMSAFVSADWLQHHPDGSLAIVFLIGMAVGLLLGAGNALLVAFFRLPAIVATLGTLAIYRGGVIVYAEGRQISATVLPPGYGHIAEIHILGVPLLVWLALLITVAVGLAARFTRTGRNLYALGSNPEGARLAGIDERKHLALVFMFSGLLCGLVGVLWGARFGTVDAIIAPDLNLQVISAAVIGGVSIFGGSGTAFGAAIGAAIFAVLQNGVQLLGISQFWLQAVVGAVILVTVFLYNVFARRTERSERDSRRRSAVQGNTR